MSDANSVPVKVQWPAKALASEGDDLAPALRSLLEDLRLLETKADEKDGVTPARTPQTLQVLTAGSTTLTKLYAALAAAVGGGGAILAAVRSFWDFEGTPADQAFQRAALMIAAAVLGSAVVIAVSFMVRGDVSARAQAHAAAYEARAGVAAAFLRTVGSALPKAPAETPYFIAKDNSWLKVKFFEWNDGTIQAVTDGDKVPAREMSGLLRSPDFQAQ